MTMFIPKTTTSTHTSATIPDNSTNSGSGIINTNLGDDIHAENKILKQSRVPEDVDALLARELNNMTFAERTMILEDVHGVGDFPKEESNPALLQQRLSELDIALNAIPIKPAFDEAQRLALLLPPVPVNETQTQSAVGLVNDPSYRIKFLRAERYHPHNAAVRMINNLQIIHQIFGSDGLIRPLHLSDMLLDPENQVLFSGMFIQVMPFRDRLGRRVVVRSGRKVFGKDDVCTNSRLKAYLYICQQLSDDIECQINGAVLICFPLNETRQGKFPVMDKSVKMVLDTIGQRISPIRISAVHICIPDDPWFSVGASIALRAFPKQFRIRTRVHTGSVNECCYKLMTYGIPGDQIPIKSSGIIKSMDHKKWVAFCQEREDAIFRGGGGGGFNEQQNQRPKWTTSTYPGIFCPYSKDILVGRGPRIKNHIGNERYRELLQSKYELYDYVSLIKKKEIAMEVVREIQAAGGRFLVPHENCWVETNNETARNKVSIAFRDVRKSINARKNRNYTNTISANFCASSPSSSSNQNSNSKIGTTLSMGYIPRVSR